MVTTAASQVLPLTTVPMISAKLPTTARPRWATALSRRLPPNETSSSEANPPNAANSVICGLPMTLRQITNTTGTTSVARTARIAAGTDQAGSQPRQPAPLGDPDHRRARRRPVKLTAADSDICPSSPGRAPGPLVRYPHEPRMSDPLPKIELVIEMRTRGRRESDARPRATRHRR